MTKAEIKATNLTTITLFLLTGPETILLNAKSVVDLLAEKRDEVVSPRTAKRYMEELVTNGRAEVQKEGGWKAPLAKNDPKKTKKTEVKAAVKKLEEKKAPKTVVQGVSEALEKDVAEKAPSKADTPDKNKKPAPDKKAPAKAAKPAKKVAESDALTRIRPQLVKVVKEVQKVLDTGKVANVSETWDQTGQRDFCVSNRQLIKVLDKRWTVGAEAGMILESAVVTHYETPPPAEKPEKKKTPGTKSTTPKAPKAPKKPRYTRAKALAEVLNNMKEPSTKEELSKISNEKYMENGGKDNIKESVWFLNNGLGLLEDMNVVEVKLDGEIEKVFLK